MIRVERAASGDLAVVLDIADEAARWMLSRNIRQWDSPPSEEIRGLLRREIDAGNVYLVRLAESPDAIGTFRMEWQGAPLWADEQNAGYLYSLGLRPRYIGCGLGAEVIEWVKTWLAGQGRERLRLDCIASNDRLRGWYESLGFRYRGLVTVKDLSLARYEVELTAMLGSKRDEAIQRQHP